MGSVERKVTVAGVANVPSDAAAVSVNVTVVWPSAAGFVTVWPSGQARPLASSVNFVSGSVVANAATVAVGSNGQVSLWTNAGCPQLVVDVTGWFGAGDPTGAGGFSGFTPSRVLDTRELGQGPCVGSLERKLTVAGVANVPSNAAAVSVNVTVVWPAAAGFVTVWPSGQSRPLASSVNYSSGQVVANAVTLPVGANGQIGLWTNAGCPNLVVDVTGWFAPGSPVEYGGFTGIASTRILDTREAGQGPCVGAIKRTLVVPNVPAETAAVSVNVTVVWPSAPGWVAVWPSGEAQPPTSSVNFNAGDVVANQVTVKLGTNSSIDLVTNAGCPQIVVDLTGAYRRTPPALTGVKQIVSTGFGYCALISNGTVKCWGRNNFGQIGDGTNLDRGSPTLASGIANAVELLGSSPSACARLADGTVVCWGANNWGQLGDGTTTDRSTPVVVQGVSGATRFLAPSTNTSVCVQSGAGKTCWGSGFPYVPLVPDIVGNCQVTGDSGTSCVGRDESGQLGDGLPPHATTTTSNRVTGLQGVVEVVNGDSSSCARVDDGTVRCWGGNTYGQLGIGLVGYSPSTVQGIDDAVSVVTGSNSTCAVRRDTTVWCWGANNSGQLGSTPGPDSEVPVKVPGVVGAVQLASQGGSGLPGGDELWCAELVGGSWTCWGTGPSSAIWNAPYVMGSDTPPTGVVARQLSNRCTLWSDGTGCGQSVYEVIGSGPLSAATCGVRSDHLAVCFGRNFFGQVGLDPVATSDQAAANNTDPVPGVSNAIAAVNGGESSCALIGDGSVRCWGHQRFGGLGDGVIAGSSRHISAPVIGVSTATGLDVSYGAACAALVDGTAKCWGWNYFGTDGDGTSFPNGNPVTVAGVSGASSISFKVFHACAVVDGGHVRCWGDPSGGKTGARWAWSRPQTVVPG